MSYLNHERHYESLNHLTLTGAFYGRGAEIPGQQERIKQQLSPAPINALRKITRSHNPDEPMWLLNQVSMSPKGLDDVQGPTLENHF